MNNFTLSLQLLFRIFYFSPLFSVRNQNLFLNLRNIVSCKHSPSLQNISNSLPLLFNSASSPSAQSPPFLNPISSTSIFLLPPLNLWASFLTMRWGMVVVKRYYLLDVSALLENKMPRLHKHAITWQLAHLFIGFKDINWTLVVNFLLQLNTCVCIHIYMTHIQR